MWEIESQTSVSEQMHHYAYRLKEHEKPQALLKLLCRELSPNPVSSSQRHRSMFAKYAVCCMIRASVSISCTAVCCRRIDWKI